MKQDIRYRLLMVSEIVEDGDEEYSANELMNEPEAWRPVAAEFIGEAVQENDPPVRRAIAGRLWNTGKQVMDLGKALEIVWKMAKSLYRSHGEFCEPAKCPADVTTAMDTVADFIADHIEGDDAERRARQERFSALFEAMEYHGNAEGTETQLSDAEEFLRLAFETMSPAQQAEFLDNPAVSDFVAKENGEEDTHEPNV